jgi:hypothetical protein
MPLGNGALITAPLGDKNNAPSSTIVPNADPIAAGSIATAPITGRLRRVPFSIIHRASNGLANVLFIKQLIHPFKLIAVVGKAQSLMHFTCKLKAVGFARPWSSAPLVRQANQIIEGQVLH